MEQEYILNCGVLKLSQSSIKKTSSIRVALVQNDCHLRSIIFCHIHFFYHPPSLDFFKDLPIHPSISQVFFSSLPNFFLSFPLLPRNFKMSSVLFQPSFHNTEPGQPTSANYSEVTVNPKSNISSKSHLNVLARLLFSFSPKISEGILFLDQKFHLCCPTSCLGQGAEVYSWFTLNPN